MMQIPGILNSFGRNTPQSKSHEGEFIALSHSLNAKVVRLSPGGTKHVKHCEKLNVKLKCCPCTSVKNMAVRLLLQEPSIEYQFGIQI